MIYKTTKHGCLMCFWQDFDKELFSIVEEAASPKMGVPKRRCEPQKKTSYFALY